MSQRQEEQDPVWDWDEEPPVPDSSGRASANVRIGLRFAAITIPVLAAALLLNIHGGGSPKVYHGDTTTESVLKQLASHSPLSEDAVLHCTTVDRVAGSVSQCTEFVDAGSGTIPVDFDVHFDNAQGDYSFTAPGASAGPVLHGNIFG